jgi:hypothetical protein
MRSDAIGEEAAAIGGPCADGLQSLLAEANFTRPWQLSRQSVTAR